MKEILEFIHAAAPWVVMGVLIAVFAVRSAAGRKKGVQSEGDCGMEGMCMGMGIGASIGVALDNHIGLGISLGMLAGLVIGMCIPKKKGGGDK